MRLSSTILNVEIIKWRAAVLLLLISLISLKSRKCNMAKLPNDTSHNVTVKSVLNFDTLSKGCCAKSTIIGCIVNCYPIQPSAAYGKFRKLVLKELMPDGSLGNEELPCFLYGKFVDEVRDLVRGDCITITGFEVMPNQFYKKNSKMVRYQIDVINSKDIEPEVHISKRNTLRFDNLGMTFKQYGGIYIVGRVIKSTNVKKVLGGGYEKVITLKEILPEGEVPQMSMDCILRDKIANQNKKIKVGDTVKLSGFYMEARPSTSAITDHYPYQVVLRPVRKSENEEEPSVSVVKQSKKETSESLVKPSSIYKYTLLKDLRELKADGPFETKYVNVYGVVVRCVILHVVRKCLEIVIRDPSLDSFTVLVSIRADSSSIPDVHPNDIIRVHRMYVNKHHSGLQGFCNSMNDLLIFNRSASDVVPSHTSRTFTWTDNDAKTVEILHVWSNSTTTRNTEDSSKKGISSKGTAAESGQSDCTSDIVTRQPLITVQNKMPYIESRDLRDTESCTNPPNKLIESGTENRVIRNVSSEHFGDLNKHGKDHENSTAFSKRKLFTSEEDIVCKLIKISNMDHDPEVPSEPDDVHVNDNQKSHSVDIVSVSSQNSVYQTDEAYFINAYKKSLAVRQLPKMVNHPLRIVTVVTNPNEKVVTIRDMKSADLHSRGRVQARVVDIKPHPLNSEQCLHLHCPRCLFITANKATENMTFTQIDNKKFYICPVCKKTMKKAQVLENYIVFIIKLDDGSSAINAYLLGKSAEYFFGEKEFEDPDCLDRLRKKLWTMYDSRGLDSPIIDCFLFKLDTYSGHVFHIVGTKLLF